MDKPIVAANEPIAVELKQEKLTSIAAAAAPRINPSATAPTGAVGSRPRPSRPTPMGKPGSAAASRRGLSNNRSLSGNRCRNRVPRRKSPRSASSMNSLSMDWISWVPTGRSRRWACPAAPCPAGIISRFWWPSWLVNPSKTRHRWEPSWCWAHRRPGPSACEFRSSCPT